MRVRIWKSLEAIDIDIESDDEEDDLPPCPDIAQGELCSKRVVATAFSLISNGRASFSCPEWCCLCRLAPSDTG